MEEDIVDLKKYISFASKRENFSHDTDWEWNKEVSKKIKNVLTRLKDYEQIEKEHQKENGELREKVKELEEIKRSKLDKYLHNNLWICKDLAENYIHKSKIREKIKEIKRYEDLAREMIEERIVIADSDSLNFGRKEAHGKDILVLQDLLEENK